MNKLRTRRDYKGEILIVDDVPANLKVLADMLIQHGYQVRPAISGELALRAALMARPELILLDVMMPEMDGYEVSERLKEMAETADIPIIFISALHEEVDKVKAFELGAVDFVTKPFQLREVLARVQAHLTLDRQRRKIESLVNFKNLLIRTVSHDLKNPINSIRGYSELLLTEEADPAEQTRLLQRIHSNADQMHDLVVNLLDLARLEEEIPQTRIDTSLSMLVTSEVERLQPTAVEQGLTLKMQQPTDDTTAAIDPELMARVIDNLLSNALKYTPEGGKICVWLEATADEVYMHVSDTGLGIPDTEIDYIFNHFYRVGSASHQSVKGTGLGLAITQGIVDHHGGRIWVESEEGKGSTFSVAVPRRAPLT